jgi:selenoprotein W-related protein
MKLAFQTNYILAWVFFLRGAAAFQALAPRVGLVARSATPSFLTRVAASSDDSNGHTLSIEYCIGCRWMLKSFWMAQELLTTFESDLDAVTIVPSSSKGIFTVRLDGNELLWDRKEQGGFPSPKGLKQIVRDIVEPEKFLGHSDTEDRQSGRDGEVVVPLPEAVEGIVRDEKVISLEIPNAPEPSVTIYYCTGCRWLLRAAYFGQELLTTFTDEVKSVTLVPSKPPSKGGRFVSLLFDILRVRSQVEHEL